MSVKILSRAHSQEGISLFQFAKLSISFLKEGKENEYFILSGIVKESRHYEAKIVFKQRLIGEKKGHSKLNVIALNGVQRSIAPIPPFFFFIITLL